MKSGIYTGKIVKEKIDLWKAFSILQDNGFEVRYEPPPYALQVKIKSGTVSIFENASVALHSGNSLKEIENDLKEIVKVFNEKEVLKKW